jgi:uncharacterized MAPEG superfamily protein
MQGLVVPLAVAGVLPYISTSIAKAGAFSSRDNGRTRDWQNELSGWRQRAHWSQLNGFEGYPLFAAAVICAIVLAPDSAIALQVAWGYIAFRVAFIVCFLTDRPSLRSLVWFGGLGSCIGLFVIAAAR